MIQLFASGLAIGCIYALISVGFNLLFGVARVLNFAQGDLVMLGALIAATLVSSAGLAPPAALLLAVVALAVVGVVMSRLVYMPLRRVGTDAFLIASVGVGIAVRNAAHIVWGPEPLGMRPFMASEFVSIGTARLTSQHVVIALVTAVVILVQYVLFMHTPLGRRLRAIAQDTEMARLMGVRVDRLLPVVFAISAAISGAAGALLVPIFFATPEMGGSLILKAFIAIVIGGFGSIPGAIVGGLSLGVLDTFVAAYVSSSFRDVIAYCVLIAFLLVRPKGLFGEPIAEKV